MAALGRPGRVVVCGLGARGCLAGADEGVRAFDPVDLEAPVVDTNGAGDSLAVGFLTAYVLEGRPLDEAVRRGQLGGALVLHAARHLARPDHRRRPRPPRRLLAPRHPTPGLRWQGVKLGALPPQTGVSRGGGGRR